MKSDWSDGMTEKLLLRPGEAAEALGVSPRTLWSLDIPRVRVGKRGVRYDVADIHIWIDSQKSRVDRISDV